MHRSIPLLAVAALTLGFAPATVDDPDDHTHDEPGYHYVDPADEDREIWFAEEQGWFTASGPTRIGNVDHETEGWMGWSATEPTDPAGGATAAMFYGGFREIAEADGQDRGQFTASGTMSGYLDSITLELYVVAPFQDAMCDLNLAVDLRVDGVDVLDMDGTGGPVPVSMEPAGDGVHVARLKITGIFSMMDRFSSPAFPFIGDEDSEHDVYLSVHQFPLCNEVVWVYGSQTHPSSILFNRDPSDPSVADHTTYDINDPPTP